MQFNEYQQLAERTSATATNDGCRQCISRIDHRAIRLLHASMGLNTEAGEFEDAIKKHIFYDVPLDLVNLSEELGDMFWYIAEALNAIGGEGSFVMQKNIEKLRERYPNNFTNEKAVNRDLNKERDVLEDTNK